jgi:hypothetical protein
MLTGLRNQNRGDNSHGATRLRLGQVDKPIGVLEPRSFERTQHGNAHEVSGAGGPELRLRLGLGILRLLDLQSRQSAGTEVAGEARAGRGCIGRSDIPCVPAMAA